MAVELPFKALSVISTRTSSRGSSACRIVSSIAPNRSMPLSRSVREMLKLMGKTARPSSRRCRTFLPKSRRMFRSNLQVMSAVSSGTTNWSGARKPNSGSTQRDSASYSVSLRVDTSTIGW